MRSGYYAYQDRVIILPLMATKLPAGFKGPTVEVEGKASPEVEVILSSWEEEVAATGGSRGNQ